MAGFLSEETRTEIRDALRRFGEPRSASIAALRVAQYQLGWLSPEAVAEVAEELDLDSNGLYQLVTFYDMFYTQPVGSYVLGICNNLSCYLNGSDTLRQHLEMKLGITPGETTPDGVFTLRTVECLAACGNAPAMMVNEDYYERLTVEKVDQLLAELRKQARQARGISEEAAAAEVEKLFARPKPAEPKRAPTHGPDEPEDIHWQD